MSRRHRRRRTPLSVRPPFHQPTLLLFHSPMATVHPHHHPPAAAAHQLSPGNVGDQVIVDAAVFGAGVAAGVHILQAQLSRPVRLRAPAPNGQQLAEQVSLSQKHRRTHAHATRTHSVLNAQHCDSLREQCPAGWKAGRLEGWQRHTRGRQAKRSAEHCNLLGGKRDRLRARGESTGDVPAPRR